MMNYGYDLNSSCHPELVSGSKYRFVQNLKKFAAFTLAEVLITLGIIGIVAALTIPTLISKYNKKLIEVGMEKTFRDLSNLIKISEVDNGPYETWDFSLSGSPENQKKFINKYFAPYIHLTECKGHNGKNNGKQPCFAGSDGNYYIWRYAGVEEFSNGGEYRIAPKYLLDDGRSIMILIKHTPINTSFWSYITFVVDVNGQRGTSTMGEDVFVFSLSNYLRYGDRGKPIKGFHVGGSANDGDFSASTENVRQSCQPGNSLGQQKCGILLYRNNWKFPKDYPIKF